MKHLKRFNENLGWQSLYDISGNSITQQYTFSGIDKATTFISESMKIFEKLNHHPDLLNWSGLKLLVSLKTHSSNDVTQKDWDLARELDKLYLG